MRQYLQHHALLTCVPLHAYTQTATANAIIVAVMGVKEDDSAAPVAKTEEVKTADAV